MSQLADELGELRKTMRALTARESEIKNQILSGGINDLAGMAWKIVVKEQKSKRFDKSKLPQKILDDPNYYTISSSMVVRVVENKGHEPDEDAIALFDDDV